MFNFYKTFWVLFFWCAACYSAGIAFLEIFPRKVPADVGLHAFRFMAGWAALGSILCLLAFIAGLICLVFNLGGFRDSDVD